MSPVLQAYEKLGPEATRLHKVYLAARREWKAARARMLDLWFKAGRTELEEIEYDAITRETGRLYDAMRAAQSAAAHSPRAL